jgi:hypothetical protein
MLRREALWDYTYYGRNNETGSPEVFVEPAKGFVDT